MTEAKNNGSNYGLPQDASKILKMKTFEGRMQQKIVSKAEPEEYVFFYWREHSTHLHRAPASHQRYYAHYLHEEFHAVFLIAVYLVT